jgi:hypothetical protein
VIISHVILFFQVLSTYYSFIFYSMIHDTSYDKIMYSTSPTCRKKKCLGELKQGWVLMRELKKTTSGLGDVGGVQRSLVNQGRSSKR